MTTTQFLHPLETTLTIRDTYLRYLKTAFPIQDDRIRAAFWNALDEPGLLLKGPLLEATPEFMKGCSIHELVDQGVLEPAFERLCGEDLPYDRPLYLHQEKTIRKLCQEGRNLIVTTGTGSGKTEAFLIPILNHLLKEERNGTLSSPGVRALLLYPMNALANDQMKRLRKILANDEAIKFGRYIGDTERSYDKAAEKFYRQFRGERLSKNELICRDQMRSNPPHLLLTNYSMLEYLLLRPDDHAFFDGPTASHWKFIILDEAHIYNGAIGIEIAMLLRRLKDRIVKSEPGRLQMVATSATLGGGVKDFPAVVEFASSLFGETFEWNEQDTSRQDVVKSERAARPASLSTWQEIDPSIYQRMRDLIYRSGSKVELEKLAELAKAGKIPENVIEAALQSSRDIEDAQLSLQRFLHQLLKDCQRLVHLQQILKTGTSLLESVCGNIFPDFDDRVDALVALVDLAVRARFTPGSAPLLPARYHVFARALEGAYICLNGKNHAAGQPFVFLNRREVCPHCHHLVWEFRSCYHCGSGHITGVVYEDEPILRFKCSPPPGTDPWDTTAEKAGFALINRLVLTDEDELIVEGSSLDDEHGISSDPWTLCLACGAIAQGSQMDPGCDCNDDSVVVTLNRIELEDENMISSRVSINKCSACGGRNKDGIVRPFLTGQDAPVSVLATSLYQNLPDSTDETMQWMPGKGRKLLVFSDSRQDAAFFAPYLENTYASILRRRIIMQTLLEDEDAREGRLRLKEIVRRLLERAEAAGFFTENIGFDERKDTLFKWLMMEFTALDRRMSLEGLGLLQYRLVKPQNWRPPEPLLRNPWNFTPKEAWEVLSLLIDTLRLQGCLRFPTNVDPRDEAFAPRNQILYISDKVPDPKLHVLSWMPRRGRNRRTDFLIRLLEKRSPALSLKQCEQHANELLEGVWRILTKDPAWKSYFVSETVQGYGIAYQVNHEMWEIAPIQAGQKVYRCSHCKSISTLNINDLCTSYQCDGILEPVTRETFTGEDNHYRRLYEQLENIPLSAEEHTAQWSADAALEKQQQFINGEINILSCSTTFELGVDVGELQVVLMRNMPPTTANYVQRAGRAGRRTDTAAFVLTYAQRRSHDLAYYAQPEKMVAGLVRPPVISLENDKIIRRHIHSVLFASFFRWALANYNADYRTAGGFFKKSNSGISAGDLIRQYIQSRPAEIKDSLQRLLPGDMAAFFGVNEWRWIDQLTSMGKPIGPNEAIPVLDKAEDELLGNLEHIQKAIEEALNSDSKYKYVQANRLQQMGETIENRDLFSFLGANGILPKYGFPTDTVELRTSHIHIPQANQIELQRDLRLALGEYAPGSEIIAAKRIWKSSGVYKPPSKDWTIYNYTICPYCKRVYASLTEMQGKCPACAKDMHSYRGRSSSGRFIKPEFGFVAGREETKVSGEKRPERIYASKVYFAEFRIPGQENQVIEPMETVQELSRNGFRLQRRYSRFGWLIIINEGTNGRGFRICRYCGKAEPAPKFGEMKKSGKPPAHDNPFTGRACKGGFDTYSLGHQFMTDVLELRFDGSAAITANPFTWRSVLYALLEGASAALGIRREDIDGTLSYGEGSSIPSIILYDDVPGGAGHVKRIINNLLETFQTALERVSRECCGEETSCTECLRNYRNQIFHEELKRGLAKQFLEQVLDGIRI